MDDVSINEALQNIIGESAVIARILWEQGWAEMNAGNFSIDVTEHVPSAIYDLNRFPFIEREIAQKELAERSFLVTGARSRMRELEDDPSRGVYILRISRMLDGYHLLWGGRYGEKNEPTSEFPTHLAIHQALRRRNAKENAVIHTHPTELIALTHKVGLTRDSLNRILWSMHPEMKIHVPRGVAIVPYRLPGSRALARATLEALESHGVVLWEKHGCVAVGNGLRDAFDLIDVVNKSARIFLLCRSAGMEPEGLANDQLAELEDMSGGKEEKRDE